MNEWRKTPFTQLLVDSKDGEWGDGEATVGSIESIVIRGTDFADLNHPAAQFPRRWIKAHIADRKRLTPGDIILETAGGTSTQSTGRSALLQRSFFLHHADLPVLCASFSRYLRLDRSKYSPTFIYYLLQALYRSGYMAVFNIQHTGVSRFQYTSFKNHTELQIPDRLTQKNIAALLSAYDELIENNKRRIALLEKVAEEIYREWFVRMRFPGHEKVKRVKSIPENWELLTLGYICTIKGGKRLPKGHNLSDQKTDHPYIKSRDIRGGAINETELQFVGDSTFDTIKRYIVNQGDICITIVANIGDVGIVPASLDGASLTENAVKLVSLKRGVSSMFLAYTLLMPHYKEYMQLLAAGAAQSKLGIYKIKAIKLWIPPRDLMDTFDAQIRRLRKQVQLLEKVITNAQASRNLLLPRLISGKLSVENLDIQFPPGMAEEVTAESSASTNA
jgi:type I restriction enzyme S subunit